VTPAELRNRPCGGRYEDIVAAIGNTPLVELKRLSPKPGVRIWAKLESHNPTGLGQGPRRALAHRGRRGEGLIRPGRPSSSRRRATPASRSAMICKRKGYPLKVVMPDNVTPSAPSC
jgi:cysteine synthase B